MSKYEKSFMNFFRNSNINTIYLKILTTTIIKIKFKIKSMYVFVYAFVDTIIQFELFFFSCILFFL